jgi:hypothetical protein
MPNWERNPRGDWSYYDKSGRKVEGYNPLTDLIGQTWKSAKSFIEWSDPKLARFESSVANILGEGFERVNEARKAIKEREDAIAEPIMKSIGDRLVWSDKSLKEYGEPLTNHQYNKRKDDELYQDILDLDLRHRQSKFKRQHQATTDFFTKQNAGVE